VRPDTNDKCLLCKRPRGNHRAKTDECPMGKKSRIGYLSFGPGVFTPNPADATKEAPPIKEFLL